MTFGGGGGGGFLVLLKVSLKQSASLNGCKWLINLQML